jgi:hypothetical protein
VQNIIYPILQRNAYYCHSENLLIAMIADSNDVVRKMAWRRILIAAKTNSSSRNFVVPKIDFEAMEYTKLIDWTDTTLPPLLSNLSTIQIRRMAKGNSVFLCENFPCHSQAVERYVKIVTEAAGAVCGQERRDGFIESRLKSRQVRYIKFLNSFYSEDLFF